MTLALSDAEKLNWLRLIRSENVGPITFHRLRDRYGSAGACLDALPGLAQKGGRKKIRIASKGDAEKEYDAIAASGAALIASSEESYPPLLRQIEDAPPLICVKGHTHLLKKRAIAVVGSRNASTNGKRLARDMAAALGKAGLMVVSGMARGIDTAAHTGGMETGSVAVLAGGVDIVYPKENQSLYEDLCDRGAVLSEMPLGIEPQGRHFPRRNRIISGMARGTVVMEANTRSGSLITARMALDQNREVFAVPGWPTDPRSAGANGLIREGATLTRSAEDVIEVLNDLFRQPLSEPEREPFQPLNRQNPGEDAVFKARPILMESLSPTPVSVDELIRQCQFSPAVVHTVLLELELAGRLERHPGNMVSLLD
ncbi:MAG: DNA-processing protein DprA [Magnetospiraceae bacterium]